jgi:hypothetical protein
MRTKKVNEPQKTFKGGDKLKAKNIGEKILNNEKELNVAVCKLKQIDDFFPIGSVEGIKTISEDWLNDYMGKMAVSIKQDKRFPSQMRNEILERWDKVFDEALPLCRQVHMIAQWDEVPLRYGKGRFYYDVDKLLAFINKKAETTLSGEIAEYYKLLIGLARKLEMISAWEDEHGYYPFVKNGTTVSTREGYRHVSFVDIAKENGKFDLSLDNFVFHLNNGILGKKENK